jgi:hypothetical protein
VRTLTKAVSESTPRRAKLPQNIVDPMPHAHVLRGQHRRGSLEPNSGRSLISSAGTASWGTPMNDDSATKCYDPRDHEQRADDPSTWKPTRNPALRMAEWSREPAKAIGGDIDWDWVSQVADYADEPIPYEPGSYDDDAPPSWREGELNAVPAGTSSPPARRPPERS